MMGRTIGKKQKKRNIIWLLAMGALALAVAGFLVYRYALKKPATYPLNPGPTIQDEGTTRNQEQGNQSDDGSGESSTSHGNSMSAPTLTKSSGNNGSVPSGAIIEFICHSVDGASCDIILTDSANKNNVIKLGSKTIADNGRGEFAALWEWTARQGKWSVVARATKDGASASSPAQTLEVK